MLRGWARHRHPQLHEGSGGALSSVLCGTSPSRPLCSPELLKVSLSTLLPCISKNWEFSFCQGSEVVALYSNQGFHRILFWAILKQRSGGGEGAFQWCSLRLKEGGGIQNKHMERFPHLNPICSQHWRYSNTDRNCTKPHPAGPAEEVREAVLGILANPARQRHLLHPCRKSLSVLSAALENSCPSRMFWEWEQGVPQP